jgi:hypothetical protein
MFACWLRIAREKKILEQYLKQLNLVSMMFTTFLLAFLVSLKFAACNLEECKLNYFIKDFNCARHVIE